MFFFRERRAVLCRVMVDPTGSPHESALQVPFLKRPAEVQVGKVPPAGRPANIASLTRSCGRT